MKLQDIERFLHCVRNECKEEVIREIKNYLYPWVSLARFPFYVDFGNARIERIAVGQIDIKGGSGSVFIDLDKLTQRGYYASWEIERILEILKDVVKNERNYRIKIREQTLHVKRIKERNEFVRFQIIVNNDYTPQEIINMLNRAGIEVREDGFIDKKFKLTITPDKGWEIKEGRELFEKIIKMERGEKYGVITFEKTL